MRITEDLIRRKSEHNEGVLEDLEEIALHQLEIEKIERIDRLCKDLKILLLQNNLIERLENLRRLKRLEYLNVALNNIEVVENLECCESLKKLDLTVNFIGLPRLEESLDNLKHLSSLEDLYFMGNPCTEWAGFRSFTIANLLQLKQLDGKVVTPAERIQALRALPALQEDLAKEIQRLKAAPADDSQHAYTRENRKRMYQEMAHMNRFEARVSHRLLWKQTETNSKPATEGEQHAKPFETYNSKGEIRQCNQGRLKFTMDSYSHAGLIVVTFHLPRHLSTTLIDVDVHPNYLRVTIKGKVTQLRLPEDISPDNSKVIRSQTTGDLQISMPKVSVNAEIQCLDISGKQRLAGKQAITGRSVVHSTSASAASPSIASQHSEEQKQAENLQENDPPPLEDINIFSHPGEPQLLISERVG